jgi:hypothetical protein
MVQKKLLDDKQAVDISIRIREAKARLFKEGYVCQSSIYGNLVRPDGERIYRRIEIVSRSFFTGDDYKKIHQFFTHFVPTSDYSLWRYVDGKLYPVVIK